NGGAFEQLLGAALRVQFVGGSWRHGRDGKSGAIVPAATANAPTNGPLGSNITSSRQRDFATKKRSTLANNQLWWISPPKLAIECSNPSAPPVARRPWECGRSTGGAEDL